MRSRKVELTAVYQSEVASPQTPLGLHKTRNYFSHSDSDDKYQQCIQSC